MFDLLTVARALIRLLRSLVEQIARSKGMRVALLFSGVGRDVKVSCRTSAATPSVDAAALMAQGITLLGIPRQQPPNEHRDEPER